LPQDDGKEKVRGVLMFRETKMQLALNSTHGQCIKAMFGTTLANWIGKQVTFCTETDRDPSGGGMVDAIRVLGSPDIEQDMTIEVKLPRRKPKRRTLKKTELRGKQQPKPQSQPQETAEQQPEPAADPDNDGR
jgi:hypothetical protein